MTMQQRAGSLALAVAAFAMACADPAGLDRTLLPGAPTLDVSVNPPTVNTLLPGDLAAPGRVRVCKQTPAGDPGQAWTFTIQVASQIGAAPPAAVTWDGSITGVAGQTVCETAFVSTKSGDALDRVIITEQALPANWTLDHLHIERFMHGGGPYIPPAGTPIDVGVLATREATLYVNGDMLRDVTFGNNYTAPPPPPEICDFISFGRLVWEHDGLKVVISGNAGGNSPHGGFLNEFHIEVNDVDHHVADITSYGPIAAAPLASATYTNSRRAAGLDKHGHAVELRVWDGGEPGWKSDRFWFNVNGTIVGNATTGNLIDQGNMQYHSNCRGPG